MFRPLAPLLAGAAVLAAVGTASTAAQPPLIAFATYGDGTSEAVDIAVVRPDGTGLRYLTRNSTGGYAPTWTSSGRALTYVTTNENGDTATLWRIRADGGGRTRLPGDPWYLTPSPDGTRVAELMPAGVAIRSPAGLIRLLRVPVGDRGASFETAPLWSPDGKWLAVTTGVERNASDPDLVTTWLLRTDGSATRQLSARTDEWPVAFSPNSRWLLSLGDRAYVTSPATRARHAVPGVARYAWWLSDSKRLMTFDEQRRVRFVDATTGRGREVVQLPPALGPLGDLEPSPARDDLVFTTADGVYLLRAGRHDPVRVATTCVRCTVSWRHGGREVAFTGRNGEVVDLTLATGAARVVVGPPTADVSPVWSPDRSRIAFTRGFEDENGDEIVEVLTIAPDGSGLRRVGRGAEPSWSPDSQRLAYVDEAGQILVVDVAGTVHAVVTGAEPHWSPDGTTIASLAYLEGEDGPVGATLQLVAAGGGAPRAVVDGDVLYALHWSPDGTRIAAFRESPVWNDELEDYVPTTDLVVVDAATGSTRVVENGDGWFDWSPDGSRLLHVYDSHLHVLAPSGAMLADVDLPGRATAREAAWSPDGTQYAYSQLTYEDELGVAVCDIWVSNADGSQRHRVTTTPGIDGEISWASP